MVLPFLVLHGEEDVVTDLNISRALFEKSNSQDKTFKTYPGMWHGLIFGETKENSELVFHDIIQWLNERSSSTMT